MSWILANGKTKKKFAWCLFAHSNNNENITILRKREKPYILVYFLSPQVANSMSLRFSSDHKTSAPCMSIISQWPIETSLSTFIYLTGPLLLWLYWACFQWFSVWLCWSVCSTCFVKLMKICPWLLFFSIRIRFLELQYPVLSVDISVLSERRLNRLHLHLR